MKDGDVDALCSELKENFQNDIKDLQTQKKKAEDDINSRAKKDLKEAETQLGVFLFRDSVGREIYYSNAMTL